ncbi:DUF1294 domain-containing protein [Prevotella sp.]|uniref:DUF1294 domain-containing protein n=1 Tax=Prevotella sp. TaxID=59823 RepID=UPI0025EFAFBB|nr:DUF1294 domain-containing protein [Prevotella sp.]
MNTLHTLLTFYILCINVVTLIVYGIDKYKAKKAKWRISEATLLLLAILGGSIGAWIGMKSGIIRQCIRSSNTVFLPFC